ncbi:MAG: hypothetical protein NTV46_12525 [Verrucomicrobia bacterium]|nr:hypothetical protein [Verrucomicrobiota bacterium]
MAISARVERILHEVEALNDHERDELMRALGWTDGDDHGVDLLDELTSSVQDMDEGRVRVPSHDEAKAEWRQEIHRRAREIDEGQVQLVGEEELFRKLRAL